MKYDLPAELSVTEDGPVRVLTIRRAEHLNAVNAPLHWAFAHVWRQIREDKDARAVVLTGEGRTFCAGGDFDWLVETHRDPELQDVTMDEGGRIMWEMLQFPLPVIAAVNGAAVGLGCSVAIFSDIVLVSDRAHLADPHVSVGLVAGDGGAALWPVLSHPLRVKEFLFTGDRVNAETAVELGLATRVVPHEELLDEALRVAHRVSAQPRRALQDTKRAVNVHLTRAAIGAGSTAMTGERLSMGSPEHGDRLAELRKGRA